jgi:outer membrane protein
MNSKLYLCLLISTLVFSQWSKGQDTRKWTLEECINHAYDRNLNIRQIQLNMEQAMKDFNQSKWNMLPSVNATANQNWDFSNSLDPTTFTFVDQNSNSTTFSLNTNLLLFSGLSQLRAAQLSRSNVDASIYDVEATRQDVAIAISNFFLQVLSFKESLRVAEKQLEILEEQLDQSKELVNAGVIPEGNLLELEAQLANAELTVIQSENNRNLALLSLKLALQIDPLEDFDIVEPPTDFDPLSLELFELQDVMGYALENQPTVMAAQMRTDVAERQIQINRGAFSPTFSFNFNIRANYFSLAQTRVGETPPTFPVIGFVDGTGQSVVSAQAFSTPIFDKAGFGEQLQQTYNQGVNISMNLPLFSKWQRMTNLQKSKISLQQAELQLESTENTVRENVARAHADAEASSKTYLASMKNAKAQANAYEFAKEKYALGAINALELNTTRNNYLIAESNLINSKYDYIFKRLILDVYQGRDIRTIKANP